MEAAEKAEELAAGCQDDRAVPRYGVEEDAHLLLVKHGSIVPCRILDLSLGGCRVRTLERFPAESMMCVEVNFKVKGLPFRFSGLVQWTDCQHLAGIRFEGVPRRRREELVEALSELEAAEIAKAAEPVPEKQVTTERPAEKRPAGMRVVEEQAAASQPVAIAEQPEQEAQILVQAPAQAMTAQTAAPANVKTSKRERRESSREAVETSAVIDLIKIASRLPGRIQDLSLNGCRIRTDERFPVGIYTRVETEFRLDGLPFRLGGVIQSIHDRNTVGIRFLDMSSRKREQVEQLIEEIREKKGSETREQGVVS
jgi:hypothetical protein